MPWFVDEVVNRTVVPAHTGLSILAIARVDVTLAEKATVMKFDVATEVDKKVTLEVIAHLTIFLLTSEFD